MSDTPITIKLDYTPKQECDQISDEVMEEIIRRLIATGTIGPGLGIPQYSPTAPQDKSSPWIVTNQSGLPTGKVKIYNQNTQQWETQGEEDAEPREMVTQSDSISVTGNGTFLAEFEKEFENATYQVAIVPTGNQAASTFFKATQTAKSVSVTVQGYSVAYTLEVKGTGYLKEDSE